MRVFEYIEIDLDFCGLTYGVAPCTATFEGEEPTGTDRCFNSLRTCQDRENFDNVGVTLRFAKDTVGLPRDVEAMPTIRSIQYAPGRMSLGENLGTRSKLTVQFDDHPSADTTPGTDLYHALRSYDPFGRGSYWGKFRARHPFVRGRPIRWITRYEGQAYEDAEVRHFVIESFDGPKPGSGTFTLESRDPLKMLDGDRAQAPRLSNGFLAGDIDSDDMAATLAPAGIGDLEYPASGYLNIGGKEIVAFTRSGDSLTLTGRAQLGTPAEEHDAEDRCQLVLRYEGIDPADLIADLLTGYTDIDPSWVNVDGAWTDEIASFFGRTLTGTVAEATSVRKLIDEIIVSCGLAIWWDDLGPEIGLQVIRGISSEAPLIGPDRYLEDSLSVSEQSGARLSRVQVYYGQLNPLEGLEDGNNYRSSELVVAAQAELDEGSPAIETIFSRWIPQGGRATARRTAEILTSRFQTVPRRINFDLLRSGGNPAALGARLRVEGITLQDATGGPEFVSVQVTQVGVDPARLMIEVEEMRAQTSGEPGEIFIDVSSNNVNLREIYDTLYPPPGEEGTSTVHCTIMPGVIVGSTSSEEPSFDVGDWPEGMDITITVLGRIQGAGGAGGHGGRRNGSSDGFPGDDGGTALYTRYDITLEYPDGAIWGGGGGGRGGPRYTVSGDNSYGGGGGGGGQGSQPGPGGLRGLGNFDSRNGHPGAAGTTESTGGGGSGSTITLHYDGGDGGAAGQPGDPAVYAGGSTVSGGGDAGLSIDGVSFVTLDGDPGDLLGPTDN